MLRSKETRKNWRLVVRSPTGCYKVKEHVRNWKLEGRSPNRCCEVETCKTLEGRRKITNQCCEVKRHVKTGG